MAVVIARMRGATKVLMLALALALGAWLLSGDAPQADASHTKIIVSKSSTSPTAEGSVLLARNGQPLTLYVWAVNVHNATGASAFEVSVDYPPEVMEMTGLTYSSSWIASSGRSPACIAGIGPNPSLGLEEGQGYASCNTILPPPPYGAIGTGLLGSFTLQAGDQLGLSVLNFAGSKLVNTPVNPEDQTPIPATVPNLYVTVAKCADFNGDHVVSLLDDVFDVAYRFGMYSSNPQWDPMYDLDDNNVIDLLNDIFFAAFQFGSTC